jgi:hypothetical protein
MHPPGLADMADFLSDIGINAPRAASNIRDKRGVLEWAFEAKAGEVRDINFNFAWRIRWPKDKGVVMVPTG